MQANWRALTVSACLILSGDGLVSLLRAELPAVPRSAAAGAAAGVGVAADAAELAADAKRRARDVLLYRPRQRATAGLIRSDDVALVPELELQAPPRANLSKTEARQQIRETVVGIKQLNAGTPDGFILALRVHRADLAGLPFLVGTACRRTGEGNSQFSLAVTQVHGILAGGMILNLPTESTHWLVRQEIDKFWALYEGIGAGAHPNLAEVRDLVETASQRYHQLRLNDDELHEALTNLNQQIAEMSKAPPLPPLERADLDHAPPARVAALVQILATQSGYMRLRLVKYLSGVAHPEATRALARLALFEADEEVRRAAVHVLKTRRERDYTGLLLFGLRYPLPAVARRAAEAAAQLDRTDLIPELVRQLERPDPRAPVKVKNRGYRVREVVRVNHHKSCLLCHAPAGTGESIETLTATIPQPGTELPRFGSGYLAETVPNLMVRADTTYLRPDFSALLPVADASPWPELQRFDFLVRTRELTAKEADSFRAQLRPREDGQLSPYHRSALAALRDLTGRDTAATAEAWRRLLRMPPR